MWKTQPGSTGRLLQLSIAYFIFYVITGITVKYFTGKGAGFPGMHDMEFLVYSTVGGTCVCLGWVLLRRWYRLRSNGPVTWGGLSFPAEYLYIIPSGVCTAVVIVTTTLNYMLLPSVMVAMVVTRGSVIVISRAVDAVQIGQGILHKKVYWEEDVAVVIALLAVATQILFHGGAPNAHAKVFTELSIAGQSCWLGWAGNSGGASSGWSVAAMLVLAFYVVAYAFRIYIMNYYKNTRGKGVPLDNQGFFAVEQIAAAIAIAVGAAIVFLLAAGAASKALTLYRGAIVHPRPLWHWAIVAGGFYGGVAFFSVFIFMFKGRTATFAGLVNRLTSLMAGTTATLALYFLFGMRFPKAEDWASLVFILMAVGCLTLAERRRAAELAAAREISATALPQVPPPVPAARKGQA